MSSTKAAAVILAMSILLPSPASVVPAAATSTKKEMEELLTMEKDMQKAKYFTFVTLINMVQDSIPYNTTFLMPSDRALSKAAMPETEVLDFLLRHSIPSPLPFREISHLPTGTVIPTNLPGYMLKVSNGGRRKFYFNNVMVTRANICASGLLFRCHGVSNVLAEAPETGSGGQGIMMANPPAAQRAPALPPPSVQSLAGVGPRPRVPSLADSVRGGWFGSPGLCVLAMLLMLQ